MANYYQNYQQNQNTELDWDGVIDYEESYILLPEGDYQFRVVNITQARHEGSDKIPPCKKIIADFAIITDDGQEINVKENFILHSSMVWKLSQFFVSIGMMKEGEKGFKMLWKESIGKTGMCKIIIHKYKNRNGDDRKINRIDKLYPAYDLPQNQLSQMPAQGGYRPGWKG